MFKSKMGGEEMPQQIAGQNNDQKENNMEKKKGLEAVVLCKVGLISASGVDAGIMALSGALQDDEDPKYEFDVDKYSIRTNEHSHGYEPEVLEQMYKEFADKDFIGISSVGFNYDEKVIPLINALKEKYPEKPIVVGGDQFRNNPRLSWSQLKGKVDALCYGEGVMDFPVLLKNWNNRFNPEIRSTIKNFILEDGDLDKMEQDHKLSRSEKGKMQITRDHLTQEQTDRFTPDFSFDNLYVMHEGKLVKATPSNMANTIQHQYAQDKNMVIYAFMRGCPHKCAYCDYPNEHAKQLGARLTVKSVDKAISEMKLAKEALLEAIKKEEQETGIKGPEPYMLLMNSDTSVLSPSELTEFAEKYKQEIGLPFYCMNHPNSVTRVSYKKEIVEECDDHGEKKKIKRNMLDKNNQPVVEMDGLSRVRLLYEAGMRDMNIGVQTDEESNIKYFDRNQKNDKVVEVSEIIQQLRAEGKEVNLLADFIIYNPFEDRKDIRKTVNLVKSMKPPFDYIPHTLFLGPSSGLFEKYQKQQEETGGQMDKLLQECQDGEVSNFHDSYRFYRKLRGNKEFVANTFCEFMAGQINNKNFGRLPRYAKDLALWPSFQKNKLMETVDLEIEKKIHNGNTDLANPEWLASYKKEKEADIDQFIQFISQKIKQVSGEDLAIDFLLKDEVLDYFNNNGDGSDRKNIFINIALTLKRIQPQKFSNEKEGLKNMTYEEEFKDESPVLNF